MTDSESSKKPVERAEGITAAERYLKRLCDRSFLRLWSYAGIYRDQGVAARKEGKELCDLLVVFDKHILIFSDKDCEFPRSGDTQLDWSRWFRRAIAKSADQIRGAERWIREHPDRLFLDRRCQQPFPINLPDPSTAEFHRIVVAHGGARRCHEELGGSGSFMLMPDFKGSAHYEPVESVMPFAIGDIDPSRGFVHVFDDTSLSILMKTLNTISDFVAYLTKKERLIRSGRLLSAAGEEDLMSYYLKYLNKEGEHDFHIPDNYTHIVVDQGFYEAFEKRPERKAQLKADEISYVWDHLIDRFLEFAMAGTQHHASHDLREQEVVYRWMARESRFRRRSLSKAIMGLLAKTSADRVGARVLCLNRTETSWEDPCYVFLLTPRKADLEQYRKERSAALFAYCMATKAKMPKARRIIGIATESGLDGPRSEDVLFIDATTWSDEQEAQAQEFHRELGLLKNAREVPFAEDEYPEPPKEPQHSAVSLTMPNNPRNKPCPCNSGKKYKKCHGR